jgi:hypothetical protein
MDQFSEKGRLIILTIEGGLTQDPLAEATSGWHGLPVA